MNGAEGTPAAGTSTGAETAALGHAELLQRQHATSPNPETHLSYEQRQEQEQAEAAPPANGTAGAPGRKTREPDFGSESAFPSLGAPSTAPKTSGGWGSGPALSARLNMAAAAAAAQPRKAAAPRPSASTAGKPQAVSGPMHTETLILQTKSVSIGPVPHQYRERGPRAAGEKREEDPKTLPDVIRAVQRRHPAVYIESSTSRETVSVLFRTPLNLPPRAPGSSLAPEDRIAHARSELVARVSKKVTETVIVPQRFRAAIIGPKGKILKQIIDSTGAEVNISKKDNLDAEDTAPNGAAAAADDSATDTVTISGEVSSVRAAREQILAIVDERNSRLTQRITSIPIEDHPLINGAKGSKMATLVRAAGGGDAEAELDVVVHVPPFHPRYTSSTIAVNGPEAQESARPAGADAPSKKDDAIVVTGHRDLVAKVVSAIEAAYDDLKRTIRPFEIELPKRQHRLIVQAIEEVLESTGSLVEVPAASDPSEKVVIRGEQMANVQALQLVLEKANAMSIDTINLASVHKGSPDAQVYGQRAARYLLVRGKLRAIQDAHAGVKVYLPRPDSSAADGGAIEIIGKSKDDVKNARTAILEVLKSLPPEAFAVVQLDPLIHRHLIGKKGSRIKTFRDTKGVDVIFPHEAEQRSDVLLVYAPGHSPDQKETTTEILEGVKAELQKLGKEAADIKVVTLTVPAKLHGYILGPHGTTLNAIIGEERTTHVNLGSGSQHDGKSSDSPDQILIRGPSDEMARVEAEIRRLAEEAKDHDTINSYTVEFELDSKHIGRIVGKNGVGVTKLRDDLGVRIDFSDGVADGTASGSKKKAKTSVKIKGRKENAEEAQKRILAQSERFADEVTVHVPLAPEIDRGSLLGKGGKYILRLQEAHSVFINVPTRNDDEPNGEDAIVIRGPKKGADAARKELIEVMEYEREHGHSAVITVSTRAVPRILGKGGKQATQIKEESGITDLDVQRGDSSSDITIRGTVRAVAAARKLISQIASEADDDTTIEVSIDPSFHQVLIGKGGAKIRELVQRADATADARAVRFPRPGASPETADVVTIRGSKAVVEKVKAELLKEVDSIKDRVCLGVSIPKSLHSAIIGRGAAGLKEIQAQFDVLIHPPGWREWATAGEPINVADLGEVNDSDLIKVVGSAKGCEAAAAALQSRRPKDQPAPKGAHVREVSVPVRFHHSVARQGKFFRELPRGVRVSHGSAKPPPASASRSLPPRKPKTASDAASSARIDATGDDDEPAFDWEVHEIPADGGAGNDDTIPWIITADSERDAAEVEQSIVGAVRDASEAQAVAYCTVPQSSMARVIGRGGSGLATLRGSGAHVETLGGRRGSDTLSVVGTRDQLAAVRDGIEKLLSR